MAVDQLEVFPALRLEGGTRVPGDKSIAHRAVLATLVAPGRARFLNLPTGLDVLASVEAARALGVEMRAEKPTISSLTLDWTILSDTLRESGERLNLDAGNSGTTMRLLAGIVAGRPGSYRLDGDASLRRRPMGRVVQPLREMGAEIGCLEPGCVPPLTVRGRPLRGTHLTLATPSAQVKSALLLAGLRAAGTTTVVEPAPTRDHTERLLRFLGADVREEEPCRLVVKSTNLELRDVIVPGDLSSAAFLFAAAAILPGSSVEVTELGLNPTRTAFLDLLERYGATVERSDLHELCGEPRGTVRVSAGDRKALEIKPADVPLLIDELPLVGVLGALAEGTTSVSGAGELRVKESDRIAALTQALGKLGADVSAHTDGFTVRGTGRLAGASVVDGAGDHRIAMAAAVAALAAAEPTVVTGWDAVAISFPGFEDLLETLAVR